MEMVAVEHVSTEFPETVVEFGTSVFADGSGEAEPFVWVMGAEFAFKVGHGVCPDPECRSVNPAWQFELFVRTVNGAGAEFASVGFDVAHDPEGRSALGLSGPALAMSASDPVVFIAALMDPEGPMARLLEWAAEVASELEVLAGAEAFARVLDERS